jgi:hypothetical protein
MKFLFGLNHFALLPICRCVNYYLGWLLFREGLLEAALFARPKHTKGRLAQTFHCPRNDELVEG